MSRPSRTLDRHTPLPTTLYSRPSVVFIKENSLLVVKPVPLYARYPQHFTFQWKPVEIRLSLLQVKLSSRGDRRKIDLHIAWCAISSCFPIKKILGAALSISEIELPIFNHSNVIIAFLHLVII